MQGAAKNVIVNGAPTKKANKNLENYISQDNNSYTPSYEFDCIFNCTIK